MSVLKLFLFNSGVHPLIQCIGLKIQLNLTQSHLLVSWNEEEKFSVRIPLPAVLVDPESSIVSFRALDDHIEAKLALLLPVDHLLISCLDSSTNFSVGGGGTEVSNPFVPLDMGSDLKSLSQSEGTCFYCRKCSTRLTRTPLRCFMELPSANWREMADNWFDACCCSFGSASENLVKKYAETYRCERGLCLLSATTVTLHMDDVVERKIEPSAGSALEAPSRNQRFLVNGFLENVFMARSYHLSSDIRWNQFVCPVCSSLLGAYPRLNDDVLVDDGVRFFKCFLSTSLPVGAQGDLFRKYTLERMISNQLIESSREDLSYRTVIRGLTTRSPMLLIVLLNPNSWCCSGVSTEMGRQIEELVPEVANLHPIAKVLFSCSHDSGAASHRDEIEKGMKDNLVDQVFMLEPLVKELIAILTSASFFLPLSASSFKNLSLSSLLR